MSSRAVGLPLRCSAPSGIPGASTRRRKGWGRSGSRSPGWATARARCSRASSTTGPAIRPRRAGVLHPEIGGYRLEDIEAVAAFDVDRRKVGQPLEEAAFAAAEQHGGLPGEAPGLGRDGADGARARRRRRRTWREAPAERAFRVADAPPCDVVARAPREPAPRCSSATCRSAPSRRSATTPKPASRRASRSSTACRSSSRRTRSGPRASQARGLPVVGDDIKSQVGATIMHRMLARLFGDRGAQLERTYQLNTGGNTDFLNMLERKPARVEEALEDRGRAVAARRAARGRRTSTSARPTTSPGRTTTRSASSAWSGAASATCR